MVFEKSLFRSRWSIPPEALTSETPMTDDLTRLEPTRRRFIRNGVVVAGGLTVGAGAMGAAAAKGGNPGAPSFDPEIYADGVAWGTKFTTVLPEPNWNDRSFDVLVFIVEGPGRTAPPLQLPISEAGPGNPAYNGGRWVSKTVTVTGAYDPNDPITDYGAFLEAQGDEVFSGFIDGAPLDANGTPVRPEYFQCPLVPVKDE